MSTLPGFALKRAAAAMQSKFASRLAPLELRPTDAAIILQVDANPGITQSALGKNLAIKRANMAPIIARLEQMNLFERSPVDGRSHGLVLTETGRALLAQVQAIIDLHEDYLMNLIPAKHRAHFLPALRKLW